jgi:hypothetical protein
MKDDKALIEVFDNWKIKAFVYDGAVGVDIIKVATYVEKYLHRIGMDIPVVPIQSDWKKYV